MDDGLVFTCRKGELFKVPSLYVDWIPEKAMLIKVAQCDSWIVRFRLNVFPPPSITQTLRFYHIKSERLTNVLKPTKTWNIGWSLAYPCIGTFACSENHSNKKPDQVTKTEK